MQRHIDGLGRISIPKELRNELHIDLYDNLEVTIQGGKIVLSKIDSSCIFCGSSDELMKYDEYEICQKCREQIAKFEQAIRG